MVGSGWTFFGPRHGMRPRASMAGAALALVFAFQTLVEVTDTYPLYMVAFAFVGAGAFVWIGIRAKALVSLILVPIALLWCNPLLGGNWFTTQGPMWFLAHASLAMLFGIAAYTYAATDRH